MNQEQDPFQIISVQKIWDQALHNAFTDLVFFQKTWFCTFREAEKHVHGPNGVIRIIASKDGVEWFSIAVIEEPGVDLRDPKLCETPDGRLMLLAGGSVYDEDHDFVNRQPRVSFSSDGIAWSPFTVILEPGEWLWRVTWHQGKAYGVSYRNSDPLDQKSEWLLTLFESNDGLSFNICASWDIPGHPNETTLRFLPTGKMMALVRRDRLKGDTTSDESAWIGISDFPYINWSWHSPAVYFGGPNFLILDDGSMWAAGRVFVKEGKKKNPKTMLARLALDKITPVIILPSGGDTSYPGMVYHDGELWISYYSSHDEKAAIYLAKLKRL